MNQFVELVKWCERNNGKFKVKFHKNLGVMRLRLSWEIREERYSLISDVPLVEMQFSYFGNIISHELEILLIRANRNGETK